MKRNYTISGSHSKFKTMSSELDSSTFFLQKAFELAHSLGLEFFIGVALSGERLWATNGVKLKNDFQQKELHFREGDSWWHPETSVKPLLKDVSFDDWSFLDSPKHSPDQCLKSDSQDEYLRNYEKPTQDTTCNDDITQNDLQVEGPAVGTVCGQEQPPTHPFSSPILPSSTDVLSHDQEPNSNLEEGIETNEVAEQERQKLSSGPDIENTPSTKPTNLPAQCGFGICKKKFINLSELKEHKLRAHKLKKRGRSTSLTPEYRQNRRPVNPNHSNNKVSKESDTLDTLFQCGECSNSFSTMIALVNHVTKDHNAVNSDKCYLYANYGVDMGSSPGNHTTLNETPAQTDSFTEVPSSCKETEVPSSCKETDTVSGPDDGTMTPQFNSKFEKVVILDDFKPEIPDEKSCSFRIDDIGHKAHGKCEGQTPVVTDEKAPSFQCSQFGLNFSDEDLRRDHVDDLQVDREASSITAELSERLTDEYLYSSIMSSTASEMILNPYERETFAKSPNDSEDAMKASTGTQTHRQIGQENVSEEIGRTTPFKGKWPPKLGKMIDMGCRSIDCPSCPKKFSSKIGLAMHMRMHREAKFECDQCGQKFEWQTQLRSHVVHKCKKKKASKKK